MTARGNEVQYALARVIAAWKSEHGGNAPTLAQLARVTGKGKSTINYIRLRALASGVLIEGESGTELPGEKYIPPAFTNGEENAL